MFPVFWINFFLNKLLSNLYSDLMLCTLSKTFRILAYSELYSGILMHIQAYSAVLRHAQTCWGIIKGYSHLFRHIQHIVSLSYSQPGHIPSPSIFRTRGYSKFLWNFDQAYSELCHSQNSFFRYYSAISRHIHNFV